MQDTVDLRLWERSHLNEEHPLIEGVNYNLGKEITEVSNSCIDLGVTFIKDLSCELSVCVCGGGTTTCNFSGQLGDGKHLTSL